MKRRIMLLVVAFGVAILAASFNFRDNSSVGATGTSSYLVPSATSPTTTSSTDSWVYSLSASGRYAIVHSNSANSTLGSSGSMVLDTQTGISAKYIVSTASVAGSPSQLSTGAMISETGRYIAFTSSDTNLIDGTTTSGTNAQLYLRDTTAGTTTLLSKDGSGNLANAPIDNVEGVSEDGRFVLFATEATNLASNATNGIDNFIMLDRSTNSFTIMNLDTSGNDPAGNSNFSKQYDAAMSCDGSLVAFAYRGDLNSTDGGYMTTYLLDRRAGNKLTTLAANAAAPTISCNGDYVGIISQAHLDPNFPTASQYHAYIYDRINNTYHMVDQSSSGAAANENVAVNYAAPSYDYACNSIQGDLISLAYM